MSVRSSSPEAHHRRVCAALFVLCFTAYSLVFNGEENPNALSRIALSLAIVEHGSPYIDEIAVTTPDRARVGARFASDKAPGVSVLAAPAVAVAAATMHGLDPNLRWVSDRGRPTAALRLLIGIATVSTSGLLGALGVVALFDAALRLGAGREESLRAVLLLAFATPFWGWSTALFGHVPSAAFVVFALWTVARTTATGRGAPRASVALGAFLTGLLLSVAVAIEYPAAPAAVCVFVFAAFRFRTSPRAARVRAAGAALAGVVLIGAPLVVYNALVFGSPLSIGYARTGFGGMRQGLFGVQLPDAAVLGHLVAGLKRGLLWVSPLLVLAPIAMRDQWRAKSYDVLALCALAAATFFLINAGYVYWEGGWSTGPRHVTGALPFLALPFAWLRLRTDCRGLASVAMALGVASVIVNLAAATCGMEAPDSVSDVLGGFLWPTVIEKGPRSLMLARAGAPPWVALAVYVALLALAARHLAHCVDAWDESLVERS